MRLCRRLAWVVVIAGCLLRLSHLDAPMTGDEAHMLRFYASGSVEYIRSTYNAANNHVLLSLLLHGLDAVWPRRLMMILTEEWPLRLPSIAASWLTLAMTGILACELAGPPAGVGACLALSLSFWHLLYSHMARGYSLAAFFNVLGVWLALRAVRGRGLWNAPAAGVAAALALYTLPSNALYAAALAGWLVWLWRRRPRPALSRRAGKRQLAAPAAAPWGALFWCAVGSAGLAAFLYLPILPSLRRTVAGLGSGMGRGALSGALYQARQWAAVLGPSPVWGAAVAGLAAFGLWSARGSARRRRAAALAAAFIALPLVLALTARFEELPTRFYTGALPFWALAAGLGLQALGHAARRAFHFRRAALGPVWAAAAAALLALAAPSVMGFRAWNRGLDARAAMAAVLERTREEDDFSVICLPSGDRADPFGLIAWQYYGLVASLEPDWYVHLGPVAAYRLGRLAIVISESEGQAREALERSGASAARLAALRPGRRVGRMVLYESQLDAAALKRCLREGSDARLSPRRRAEALADAGEGELAEGHVAGALAALRAAVAMAPDFPRARHRLGEALMLSLDDRGAAVQWEWLVEHDTSDVHAPFFYAQALQQLGRLEEARRWLSWYASPLAPGSAWIMNLRAQSALSHLGPPIALGDGGALALTLAAKAFFDRADFERSAALCARVNAQAVVPQCRQGLVLSLGSIHRYAESLRLMAKYIPAGDVALRPVAVRQLVDKGRLAEAREEAEKVRAQWPRGAVAAELDALLDRR